MAALKIVAVLALFALATAQPTGGAGGIAGKVEGGAAVGLNAGKGVEGQGKHWAGEGEKDCEDGVKSITGHGGAGGIESQVEGGAEKAFKAGNGVVGQGKHWAGEGEKVCEDGAKGVAGQFENGVGQFGHGAGGGHGGLGGAGEGGIGDYIGVGIGVAKNFFGLFGGGC